MFLILGGLTSTYQGQDIGPDFINYHLYSGELVVEARGSQDIIAASLQTFHNPVYYAFYYFLFTTFPAVLAGLLLGAIHGMIGFATYLLTMNLLEEKNLTSKFTSIVAGFLGFNSPFVIGTIGGSFSDLSQSIIVIFGLYFICRADLFNKQKKLSTGAIIFAFFGGLLISGGAFLKLSHFFMAGALAFSVIIFSLNLGIKRFSTNVFIVGFGGIFGLLLTNFWWAQKLFRLTGSPVYPYLNSFFNSQNNISLFEDASHSNFPAQAAANNFHEFLVGPYHWATHRPPPSEWLFTDIRILLFSIIFLIIIALIALRLLLYDFLKINIFSKLRHIRLSLKPNVFFIAIFLLIAYLQWVFTVGAIRYAIGIFALYGVLIFCILYSLIKIKRVLIPFLSLIAFFIWLAMDSVYFGRMPWPNSWATQLVKHEQIGPPKLYLMHANSFWIPFFDDESIFMRVRHLQKQDKFLTYAKSTIRSYQGKIAIIMGLPFGGDINGRDKTNEWLNELDYKIDHNTCQDFKINYADYRIYYCDTVEKNVVLESPEIEIFLKDRLKPRIMNIYGFNQDKIIRKSGGDIALFDYSAEGLDLNLKLSNASELKPSLLKVIFNHSERFLWISEKDQVFQLKNNTGSFSYQLSIIPLNDCNISKETPSRVSIDSLSLVKKGSLTSKNIVTPYKTKLEALRNSPTKSGKHNSDSFLDEC